MAVSLKIRDRLRMLGAEVIMTRESNDVDSGNIDRAEIANKNAADIAVRMHAYGSESSSIDGNQIL